MKKSAALRRRKALKAGFIITILALPLLQFSIFYIWVNARSFLLAFQRMDKNYNVVFCGLQNFREVVTEFTHADRTMRVNLINSLLFFLVGTGVGMPLHLTIAFLVYKKIRGTGVFRVIVMLPSIISSMIMALVFQRLAYELPTALTKFGMNFPKILDSGNPNLFWTVAIYNLWVGFGGGIVIYPSAMGAIDNEIIEAAKIDGCSFFQEYIRIVLPLIVPTITTYLVTGFAGIFGAMGPNLIFWGYEAPAQSSTIGYSLNAQVLGTGAPAYGKATALGILCAIVVFPLTMLLKWFLEKADPVND